MHHRSRLALLAFVPLAFFVTGFATLGDYGVNGDEPHHFERGQAFLHYYLTGSPNYDNVPGLHDSIANKTADPLATNLFDRPTDDAVGLRFSVYQDPDYPASLFLASNEMGHPPLNGILAAATNKLFYQQLGWVGDVESYHLFEILVATLGVGLVMWWAYLEFGVVAALIAGLALALHPMYLGESRFNIKDPMETVAYTATLFALWQAFRQRLQSPTQRVRWLLVAGLAGGIGLATKFNILFVVPTVGLWLVILGVQKIVSSIWYRVFGTKHQSHNTQYTIQDTSSRWTGRHVLFGTLLAGALAFAIFYGSWPYLWTAPLDHIRQVIDYYQGIGAGEIYSDLFLKESGWDLYPLLDVIFRAPLITLLLAAISTAGFVRYWKTPQFATLLLWFVWVVIPVLRACVPHASIYGATRQIMEYLPALALFAGVGASMIIESVTRWTEARSQKLEVRRTTPKSLVGPSHQVTSWLTAPTIVITLLILCYLPVTITMIRFHPNPQLFYNSLIGGLKGAHEVNFPFWYNTMGNQYAHAIEWLNTNAEPNAKVSLVFNSIWSLPPGRLRPEIQLSTHQLDHFSREAHEGEYLVSLIPVGTTSWTTTYQSATTRYLDRFVDPIYRYKVDGVELLRIWKNDLAHQINVPVVAAVPIRPVTIETTAHQLLIDFGAVHQFDRVELTSTVTNNCTPVANGYLAISLDGEQWERIDNLSEQSQPLTYHFTGERARYFSIEQDLSSCLLSEPSVQAWTYVESR